MTIIFATYDTLMIELRGTSNDDNPRCRIYHSLKNIIPILVPVFLCRWPSVYSNTITMQCKQVEDDYSACRMGNVFYEINSPTCVYFVYRKVNCPMEQTNLITRLSIWYHTGTHTQPQKYTHMHIIYTYMYIVCTQLTYILRSGRDGQILHMKLSWFIILSCRKICISLQYQRILLLMVS